MHLSLLFIIGIALFGGLLGASFFQSIRIPQVVGYISIGLIAGISGLGIIDETTIETLKPFNLFALGIIGFLVGSELQVSTFKKYSRQFTAILLGEGLGAFFLVSIPATLLLKVIGCPWAVALAGGVVFGAISSATDPASTMNVLWEYRAGGVLTTSLTAIVALDDALAMTLYGVGTATAQILTGSNPQILDSFVHIGVELFGAIILGGLFAGIMAWLLRWYRDKERGLSISLGLILILISVARSFNMDVILAAMSMGFFLTNTIPQRSKSIFEIVRGVSSPIYVMFFVIVGASLSLGSMPGWLWGIIGIYIIGRTAGKMAGTWLGAKLSKSHSSVRRYLGLGLFCQGGVAVGLSIVASERLGTIMITDELALGQVIIFGITATTLIVQIIGPPMVKLAINRAGESQCNITAEDIEASWTVRNVVEDITGVPENTPMQKVVQWFAEVRHNVCPVIGRDNALLGIISLDSLRNILHDRDSWEWLLAADLMDMTAPVVTPDVSLRNVRETMQRSGRDTLIVVEPGEGSANRMVGVVNLADLQERVQRELLRINPTICPVPHSI